MKLIDALKAKYKDPQAALTALGLDAALIAMDEVKHDPATGQFAGTSGSGGKGSPNTAENHLKSQAEHEEAAGHHRVLSNKSSLSRHSGAAREHSSAANLHRMAGKDPDFHNHATAASESAYKLSKAAHEKEPNGFKPPPQLTANGTRTKGTAIAGDNKENGMTTTKLSPTALVALGAVNAYLRPRLAQDAKITWPKNLWPGITPKTLSARRGAIADAVRAVVKGRLAQDADVEDVDDVIDAIEAMKDDIADMTTAPVEEPPLEDPDNDKIEDEDNDSAVCAFLQEHYPEVLDQYKASMAGAGDESDEERKKREDEEAAKKAKDAELPANLVTKKAMDEAIRSAVAKATTHVQASARAVQEARQAVRPYVGELALAFDSAEDVYAEALKMCGVKTDDVHPSAFPRLLEMLPRAGSRPRVAQDAAAPAGGSFSARFPAAGRIGLA